MRKKVFAALLAVCMVVAMLPVSAFAVGEEAPAADPVVVSYGFLWESQEEDTDLRGNFKVGINDMMDQTMYVIYDKPASSGFLWFEVETKGLEENAEKLVWGCAGDPARQHYFSFLNTNSQWDLDPREPDNSDNGGLTAGTAVTLKVYLTAEDLSTKATDAEKKPAATDKLILNESFTLTEEDTAVLTENYKVSIDEVLFVEDKADWDALINDLSEESANVIAGPGFSEGVNGTYAEFPWIVVRYNRQLGNAPVYITVQPGAGSGIYDSYSVKSTFGGLGDSEDAVAAFALGESVQADKLQILPEDQAREYTITFSTETKGKGVVLDTGKATFELPTYTPKIEVTDELVESDPLTFSAPDADGKIAVSGSVKYVLNADAAKTHPVTLKITDPKTGKKIQMINSDPLVNYTLTMDTIYLTESKSPVTLEVKAGEEIVSGTYQYNTTYTLDFSGVKLAEPADVKVPAEVKVDSAEVDVNGIAGTTVGSSAVADAIKVAEATAIGGTGVAGVEVALTNVTIDAKLDADEEKNVSGSQLVLENAGVAQLLAKDAQTLTVNAPVAKDEKVTVALPQEVLKNAGEDDLTVKVTKTAAKDLTEVGAEDSKSKVLAEYDVKVVGQEVKELKENITIKIKKPASAAAVAWVKDDGSLEVIEDADLTGDYAIIPVNHLTKFVFLTASQAADETIVPINYTITVGDAEENVAGGYSRDISVTGKAGETVTLISYVNSGDATAVVIDQVTLTDGTATATISYGELNDSIDLQVTNGKKMNDAAFKSLAIKMDVPVK